MNYLIVVKQPNVMTPRIYSTIRSEPPTIEEMIWGGANISLTGGDVVTVDEVSSTLFNAVSSIPLRWGGPSFADFKVKGLDK